MIKEKRHMAGKKQRKSLLSWLCHDHKELYLTCHREEGLRHNDMAAHKASFYKGMGAIIMALALSVLLPISSAKAQCSNPAGTEGEMIYNEDYSMVQYCDDTNWIATSPVSNYQIVEDFEGGATGWSVSTFDNTEPVFSQFLGRFHNNAFAQETSKTFVLPGNQSEVELSFDYYEIDSGDGANINDAEGVYLYINDIAYDFLAAVRDDPNDDGMPESITRDFLGRFQGTAGGTQTVNKTYTLSGTQTQATINFDFYQIDSWDGEDFIIYIDDVAVITHNFADGASVPSGAGALTGLTGTYTASTSATGRILYSDRTSSFDDGVHSYSITVNTTAASLKLGFGADLGSRLEDESWGVDNIVITTNAIGSPIITNEGFDDGITSWTGWTTPTPRGCTRCTSSETLTGDLGFTPGTGVWTDEIWRQNYTIFTSASTLKIGFGGWYDEALANEAYGIDNITISTTGSSAAPEELISDGLVAYWKLDEVNGTDVIDYASNHDGTMQGGMTGGANSISGIYDSALDFNGTSDYIDTNFNPNYDGTEDFSIALWFKPDLTANTVDETLVGVYNGTDEIVLEIERDGTICDVNDLAAQIDDGPSEDNFCMSFGNNPSWQHAVFTYDEDGNGYLYVNGVQSAANAISASGNMDFTTRSVYIGAYNDNGSPNYYLDGQIDDVRFYDRVLSQEEVVQLYNARKGHIVYNQNKNIYEFFDGTEWVPMGPDVYQPNAVVFDGLDRLSRGADLTGLSDGDKLTGSFWFKRDVTDYGNTQTVYRAENNNFRMHFNAADRFSFQGWNPSLTQVLGIQSNSIDEDPSTWHHVMFSADLSTAGRRHVYIDGADAFLTENFFVVGETIDFTATDHHIGATGTDVQPLNSAMADFWLDFGTYLDLSNPINRAKFYDNGRPVFLGEDGSRVTGSAPEIFFSSGVSVWQNNLGTGGNFTENGALSEALDNPAFPDVTQGLTGWWKLDETATPIIDYVSNSDMTYNGAGAPCTITSEAGVIDKSIRMRANECVAAMSDTSLKFDAATDFSVSGWFNIDSLGDWNTYLTFKTVAGAPWQSWFLMADTSSRLIFSVGSSDLNHYVARWNGPAQENTWYHITGVKQGTTLTIYINGVDSSDVSDTFSGSVVGGSAAFQLGAGWSGSDVTHKVDDFRFYDRALSATEALAIYNNSVCQTPFGIEGTMFYNQDNNIMQYCNRQQWIGVGK